MASWLSFPFDCLEFAFKQKTIYIWRKRNYPLKETTKFRMGQPSARGMEFPKLTNCDFPLAGTP